MHLHGTASLRPFHIAPIWLWGSQSAARTHLAIARAVCKATAMNQLYGSWFFGSRLPFSALAPRAGLQYISSRIFWWKWISGSALESQSRGAGAENLALWEPQLQSRIGGQRAEIPAPKPAPDLKAVWLSYAWKGLASLIDQPSNKKK